MFHDVFCQAYNKEKRPTKRWGVFCCKSRIFFFTSILFPWNQGQLPLHRLGSAFRFKKCGHGRNSAMTADDGCADFYRTRNSCTVPVRPLPPDGGLASILVYPLSVG